MDIPKWLKESRQRAGLTQENAGALVDVTKGNWSAWEHGRHSPSIKQLARIADALHAPLPDGLKSNDANLVFTHVPEHSVTKGTQIGSLTQSVVAQVEPGGALSYIRRVPVTGTARLRADGTYEEIEAMGGMDGFVVLQTPDRTAHALRVRGDQMAPAIRDGWYVVVSPNSTPAVGEYVAVTLRDGQKMVRELLFQRADSIAVMEVNGQVRQTIPTEEVESIHAIAAVIPPSQWQPM
ncbi:helix-turn-helix domain-containing protein [Variovorax sp. GT1P44]|uniref:helix-turn-helix domain-containing protein n=1 Tax=Variovorax sp. GT1P44 TaxID=3443742 RepID=UPI003F44DBED